MKTLFFMLFVIATYNIFAQTSDADIILGKWWTEEQKGVVEVFKKDDLYYGKLLKILIPNENGGELKLDTKNPNEKYRSRPIEGIIFMFKFKYNEKTGKWENGKLYDPESGNTYDGYLKLQSDDVLDLRGYIGVTWIGRTSTWTRYKNN